MSVLCRPPLRAAEPSGISLATLLLTLEPPAPEDDDYIMIIYFKKRIKIHLFEKVSSYHLRQNCPRFFGFWWRLVKVELIEPVTNCILPKTCLM